jgi:hypothetical protein
MLIGRSATTRPCQQCPRDCNYPHSKSCSDRRSIDSAWFQRLKLEHDKLVSNLALNFNLRRYTPAAASAENDPAVGPTMSCLQSDSRVLAEQSFGASRHGSDTGARGEAWCLLMPALLYSLTPPQHMMSTRVYFPDCRRRPLRGQSRQNNER